MEHLRLVIVAGMGDLAATVIIEFLDRLVLVLALANHVDPGMGEVHPIDKFST